MLRPAARHLKQLAVPAADSRVRNEAEACCNDGAENWTILASLIECCKLNDIDAQAYLADALTKLVNLWPNSHLDELLPWAWTSAHKPTQLAA